MSRLIALAIVLGPALAYADDAPSQTPTASGSPAETTPAATAAPTAPADAPPTGASVPPDAVPASAPMPPPDAMPPAGGGDAPHDENVRVAPADMSDQALGASIGVATGGRDTVGGLRLAGNWLYQLSDEDWFDGSVAFTFGGGSAACFRDRSDTFLCDHGLADGSAIELAFDVRRFLSGQGDFWPFVRAGFGVKYARFGNDDVSGIALPLHAGGGLRVSVAPAVALTAMAQLELGLARFNHTLGLEPQLGVTIGAGAEFKL